MSETGNTCPLSRRMGQHIVQFHWCVSLQSQKLLTYINVHPKWRVGIQRFDCNVMEIPACCVRKCFTVNKSWSYIVVYCLVFLISVKGINCLTSLCTMFVLKAITEQHQYTVYMHVLSSLPIIINLDLASSDFNVETKYSVNMSSNLYFKDGIFMFH